MRTHIISSVAAVALTAGVGVALAQSPSPPGAPSGSGSERSTGQAPGTTQAPGLQDRGAKPQGQGVGSERAQERRGESSGAGATSGSSQTTGSVGSAGAAGRVSVTSDQQSKLTTVVRKVNIREASNVNATIAVGSVLPSSVELVSVPSEIIEIVPTFSSYRAIRVGGRILIVEPDTRRIVYIINV
jgi:hypothetical protein